MHKLTAVLGCCCLILAGLTAYVGWRLWTTPETSPAAASTVQGAQIDLSIPEALVAQGQREFGNTNALLYDTAADRILFEQNGFERRPIASITKLMTAMVALDHTIDWDAPADILPSEHGLGGNLLLHAGEQVRMRDLLAASLVGSANNATLAYVRQSGIDKEEFVREMNRKAIALGLEQTEFVETTGLSPDNVSTAYEVALLAQAAFEQYPEIKALTALPEYQLVVAGSGREHVVRNTNKPVREGAFEVSGSKTGFLYEAGYCLVVQGSGAQADRIAVVLNSESEPKHFQEVQQLLALP